MGTALRRNTMKLRILLALLGKPDGSLTRYGIAKLVGCTPSWVVQLIHQFEQKGLVSGTKVKTVDGLIDSYLEIAPKLAYREYYVKDPLAFLKASKLDYALTTYGAENLVSSHLFPTRYDAYIHRKDFEKWRERIIKGGLLGKGNLRLYFPVDELVIEEGTLVKGIRVVSVAQLLIDLKREGGVCGEAYEMLRDEHVRRH